MVARNAGVPQSRRTELRMGVNLGDIIVARGDIYGHGVNLGARLESLAPPGGICISADAWRHVPHSSQQFRPRAAKSRTTSPEIPIDRHCRWRILPRGFLLRGFSDACLRAAPASSASFCSARRKREHL